MMKDKLSIYFLGVMCISAFADTTTTLERNPFVIDSAPLYSQNSVESSSAFISIRYAKAGDLANLLKDAHVLSKEGSVAADVRTNSLWIQDSPKKLAAIRSFIRHIDVPLKQVLIKARIVNVDENYLQELGVKFATVNTNNVVAADGLNMDMPVAIQNTGKFTIAIARLGPNTLLDLELSALESSGHGKVISSPELMTSDRTTAYIESGEEIPYQEKSGEGNTSIAFKKAVLSLKVMPEITPNKKIMLHLIVNQDKLSSIVVQGVPAIQTREVQTQVLVGHGQTIVLGGVYEQTNSNQQERIPFLGSLPVVGGLFSQKKQGSDKRELLIFVTPEIVE